MRWCRLPCEAFQLGGIGRGGRVEDHDTDNRVVGHQRGRAVEGQGPAPEWRKRLSLRPAPAPAGRVPPNRDSTRTTAFRYQTQAQVLDRFC
jgi:hypothetical protein